MALPVTRRRAVPATVTLVWPEESAKRPLIERLQAFLTAQTPDVSRAAVRYRVGKFGLSLFAGMPNTQNINRCRLHW
ncbi:hypothetical protein M8494_32955 [Serratia ureilytica]